jgi:hypothetical protein
LNAKLQAVYSKGVEEDARVSGERRKRVVDWKASRGLEMPSLMRFNVLSFDAS